MASVTTPEFPSVRRRLTQSVIGLFTGSILFGGLGAAGLALIALGLAIVAGEFAIFLMIIGGMAGAILGAVSGALYGLVHGAFVGPGWRLFGRAGIYHPGLAGRRRVLRLGCLAVAIGLGMSYWWIEAAALPIPSEVESMTADIYGKPPTLGRSRVSFIVPAEHISRVLNALAPAYRDWFPKKWQVLGHLEVIHKDGRKTIVDLYRTDHEIGAFSVHR